MSDSIFSNYLKKGEEIVTPKVENRFVNENEDESEEVVEVKIANSNSKQDSQEKVTADIDNLIKKMLPQFGKMEEEVLERSEKLAIDNTPVDNTADSNTQLNLNSLLHKLSTSKSNTNILDTLKKKPNDIQPKKMDGLKGVEYEEYDPSKIKFLSSLPRHELLHKDHSSLIQAKQCFRKYFFSSVVNLVPAEDTNIFYPWGTSVHIYRQRLSELYGYGENEPKVFDLNKAREAHKVAAREGTEYWMANGEDQKPGSKFDWFTTERLYKTFVKCFEFWVAERKKGQIKVIAVEQYFTVQLPDGRFSSGRIDEAVIYNGELWGRDFKTTQKPEEWFLKSMIPNNQTRTYTYGNAKLSGKQCRGIIIQCIYNAKSTKKGDKGPDVYEKLIEISPYELKQWEAEQVHWNRLLQMCREHDIWPQTEVNCSYCDYQRVCAKPTEAGMLYVLENKYKHRLRDPARVDISVD